MLFSCEVAAMAVRSAATLLCLWVGMVEVAGGTAVVLLNGSTALVGGRCVALLFRASSVVLLSVTAVKSGSPVAFLCVHEAGAVVFSCSVLLFELTVPVFRSAGKTTADQASLHISS